MSDPSRDPGIENEPQWQEQPYTPDPSENRSQPGKVDSENEEAEHSIHNEPAIFPGTEETIQRAWDCPQCNRDLQGTRPGAPCPDCGWVTFERPAPTDQPSWSALLHSKLQGVTKAQSVGIVILCALAGGPWAVLGTFISSHPHPLAAIVLAPVVEEVMKVAMIWLVIEVWPWLFRRPAHIVFAALGAGLGFACIENALYLLVYIPDPTAGLVLWRWTICTALHTCCTSIAAIGMVRMWMAVMRQLRRAELRRALPWLVAAMALHGLYNGTATIMELSGFRF